MYVLPKGGLLGLLRCFDAAFLALAVLCQHGVCHIHEASASDDLLIRVIHLQDHYHISIARCVGCMCVLFAHLPLHLHVHWHLHLHVHEHDNVHSRRLPLLTGTRGTAQGLVHVMLVILSSASTASLVGVTIVRV